MTQRSRSRSPRPLEGPDTPLMLTIPRHLIPHFSDASVLLGMKRKFEVASVAIVQNLEIPDFADGIIKIMDAHKSRMLSFVGAYLEEWERNSQVKDEKICMCIPQNAVDAVKSQYLQTKTEIYVQKRIQGLPERVVEVQESSTQQAAEIIVDLYYFILDLKEPGTNGKHSPKEEVNSQHGENGKISRNGNRRSPRHSRDKSAENKIYTKAIFVIRDQYANIMRDADQSVVKALQANQDIQFSASTKYVPENKQAFIIRGPLSSVKDASCKLIRRIEDFSDRVWFLVPAWVVNKLIGIRGAMVKEIQKRSRGASVKVVSSKELTEISKYVMIQVTGACEKKVHAVELILEKVEVFKKLARKTALRQEMEQQAKRSPQQAEYSNDDKRDEKGEKSLNVVVPNDMVSRLIGRKGENVRNIMEKSNTYISFLRSHEHDYVDSPDGRRGRVATIFGDPQNIADGIREILDAIEKFDSPSSIL